MATSHFLQRIVESAASRGLPSDRNQSARKAAADRQKRVFDVAVSALALSAASPLMAAIAAAIKLDSPGPVLCRSRHWGKGGRVFQCIRFRTVGSDRKLTRVGYLLRRFALDELPQLVNVLKGEMSLVGPRPVLASEGTELPLAHLRRFDTSPGMTGLWQMQGWDRVSAGGYVSPDESYRRRWSLWLDVEILLRTIPAIVSGDFC